MALPSILQLLGLGSKADTVPDPVRKPTFATQRHRISNYTRASQAGDRLAAHNRIKPSDRVPDLQTQSSAWNLHKPGLHTGGVRFGYESLNLENAPMLTIDTRNLVSNNQLNVSAVTDAISNIQSTVNRNVDNIRIIKNDFNKFNIAAQKDFQAVNKRQDLIQGDLKTLQDHIDRNVNHLASMSIQYERKFQEKLSQLRNEEGRSEFVEDPQRQQPTIAPQPIRRTSITKNTSLFDLLTTGATVGSLLYVFWPEIKAMATEFVNSKIKDIQKYFDPSTPEFKKWKAEVNKEFVEGNRNFKSRVKRLFDEWWADEAGEARRRDQSGFDTLDEGLRTYEDRFKRYEEQNDKINSEIETWRKQQQEKTKESGPTRVIIPRPEHWPPLKEQKDLPWRYKKMQLGGPTRITIPGPQVGTAGLEHLMTSEQTGYPGISVGSKPDALIQQRMNHEESQIQDNERLRTTGHSTMPNPTNLNPLQVQPMQMGMGHIGPMGRTFDESYERQKIEEEKGQFLKFGRHTTGFEFLPGHMGRLGSPAAWAARGVSTGGSSPASMGYGGSGGYVPGGSSSGSIGANRIGGPGLLGITSPGPFSPTLQTGNLDRFRSDRDRARTVGSTITSPENIGPELTEARQKIGEELKNPRVLEQLLRFTDNEVGSQGELAQRQWIEATINRATLRNVSLSSVLNSRYFPAVTHNRNSLNSDKIKRYNKYVGEVLGGSNYSNFATDNASADVAARRVQRGLPGTWTQGEYMYVDKPYIKRRIGFLAKLQKQRDDRLDAGGSNIQSATNLQPLNLLDLTGGKGFQDANIIGFGDTESIEGGRVRQLQTSKARTRRRKLSSKLNKVLEYAADKNNVIIEVWSGGQRGIRERGPGGRVGSTRHDYGNAADVDVYTVNPDGSKGRRLLFSKTEDARILRGVVRDSAAAGAQGIGGNYNYMGDGRLHIGFGGRATWGKRGSGALPWIRGAHAQGVANPVDISNLQMGARKIEDRDEAPTTAGILKKMEKAPLEVKKPPRDFSAPREPAEQSKDVIERKEFNEQRDSIAAMKKQLAVPVEKPDKALSFEKATPAPAIEKEPVMVPKVKPAPQQTTIEVDEDGAEIKTTKSVDTGPAKTPLADVAKAQDPEIADNEAKARVTPVEQVREKPVPEGTKREYPSGASDNPVFRNHPEDRMPDSSSGGYGSYGKCWV
jgi:hypothetical protein